MEQKIKFILVGLIGVTGIFIFLFFSTFTVKQQIARERDDLKSENTTLNNKLAKFESSLRDYENKVGILNQEIDKARKEKEDADKRLELVNQEKQGLAEQLKARAASVSELSLEAAPPNADAYWARILKAKTDLEFQLNNLRNDLKSAQINNEELFRQKSALELDLNGLKREKEDLARQLEYNQKLMDSISQELVREKNDKMQIQDSFKAIKGDNTTLTRQFKSLNDKKMELEKKIAALQDDKSGIENKFSEMEAMLSDKISQINKLQNQLDNLRAGLKPGEIKKDAVELPAIVVRPQASEPQSESAPAVAIKAKVLAINRENNFVIIDSGQDLGVKAGDAYQVYRDGAAIAEVEVIESRKNISACDINKENTPIKIGDIVQ